MNLVEAFGKFGSKPRNRVRGLSAMADDGALVLNCSHEYFGHPAQGILRYEDRLSREATVTKCTGLLGEHLALARDGALPVRMVVMTVVVDKKERTRSFHVRTDLIGKLVTFDGDHFVIDFTRREEAAAAVTTGRRKGGSRSSR